MRNFVLKSLSIFLLAISSLENNAQTIDTLVNVGKYKLHFTILKGKGVPILFESGAGNDGTIWDTIIKPLHKSLGATLIRYDRAGFGQSEIDTIGLNIQTEITGLEIGLRKLGIMNRYFLVAHSLGGNYAMAFIQRHPSNVIGGVFIDILSPCFMTEIKALEVQRLFQDSLEVIKKESLGFYYIIKNYQNTSHVMRESAKTIKTPLTIICADAPPFSGKDSIKWKQCMRVFANEMNNRKLLLARDCGHYVFQENPRLVINAIIKQYKENTK